MKTITVDYEHNCETWWDAAHDEITGNPPPPCGDCIHLLREKDTVQVLNDDAAVFLTWAAQLPGWDECPFVVNEV